MKFVSLYSGGKDSTYAVWKAVQEGHEPARLLTFISENPESYMFHTPNIRLAKLGAQAMGLPIMERATKGVKEEELKDIFEDLKEVKAKDGVGMVVAGALASKYQFERVKAITDGLGLGLYSPAWQMDSVGYWGQLLGNGFEVMIVHVAAEGLGKEWLGKVITRQNFPELKKLAEKYKFHLAFEGGEAESLVLDCPLFKKRVQILKGEVEWKKDSGTYHISKAALVGKG